MTTTLPVATTSTMLPYHRQGDIDYACLDFDPTNGSYHPTLWSKNSPSRPARPARQPLHRLRGAPDTFLSSNTILCYDPTNLNVRVAPDVYLAFGVDERAIRQRRLYLPWEVGKPPDLAVEVASASTARQDVTANATSIADRGARILAFRSDGTRLLRPAAGWRAVGGRGVSADCVDQGAGRHSQGL